MFFLSIKYNLTQLGGPAHGIVIKTIPKLYQVVKRVMRVQGLAGFSGVGVYDSCENDLLSVI